MLQSKNLKKTRNIFSLVLFSVSLCLVATFGFVLYKQAQHKDNLEKEKEKIQEEFKSQSPSEDYYDVFVYDNYIVYDYDTILEFPK